MGLMDRAREAVEAAEARSEKLAQHRAAVQEAVGGVTSACSGKHYVTEVNKHSIRMQTWEAHLNLMFEKGYRLAHVLSQDGNTVQVYEHHWH